MADPTTVVREQAQPLAAAAGLDLVDVQVKGTGPRTLVRVIVDRRGGVDVAECQRVSRDLSAALDAVDPIATRYALEVTSPGIDWPLRTSRDFDRIVGRDVRIQRRVSDATTELIGTVAAAHDDAVEIDQAGSSVRVPYDEIATAKQTLPW